MDMLRLMVHLPGLMLALYSEHRSCRFDPMPLNTACRFN